MPPRKAKPEVKPEVKTKPSAKAKAALPAPPPPVRTAASQLKYEQDAIAAANAAIAKLAIEPVLMDLSQAHSYTDYLLVVSGQGSRGVSAIAEHIKEAMTERGVKLLGSEGLREGNWALLDFGDMVVHVFDQHLREFYDLESMWFDAPRLELVIPPEQRRKAAAARYDDFSPEERV